MAQIGIKMAQIGIKMAQIGVKMAQISVEMALISVQVAYGILRVDASLLSVVCVLVVGVDESSDPNDVPEFEIIQIGAHIIERENPHQMGVGEHMIRRVAHEVQGDLRKIRPTQGGGSGGEGLVDNA